MSTRCHLWFFVCFFSILASTHKTIGLICPDGLIDYFCLQNDFLIVIEALQLAFCYDFLFSVFFFIEVQLICNVVLISALQQSGLVVHIYTFFFHILFNYGLSQNIEHGCLCHMEGPWCLSFLNVIVFISYKLSRFIPLLPPSPWQTQVCSLCLWVCFCFVDWFHLCRILDSASK